MAPSPKQAIPACLAFMTGAVLMTVFIAPFYGAMEPAIDNMADDQSIIVEDFDYIEPSDTDVPQSVSLPEFAPQTEPDNPATGLTEETVPDLPQNTDTAVENDAPAVADDQPMQMLHRVIAVAAGRVEGNGHIINLDHIEVTEVGQQCQGDNGVAWNCGIHARTAFRAWLGSKTLNCRLPENGDGEVRMTTDCQLGAENAALWLVRNGWVKPVETGVYAQLGKEAENAKRGIWGNKPVSMMPEFSPLQQHSDDMPPVNHGVSNERPSGYFPPVPQE